jgi:DNA-directed RNA polymerase I subunit RPA1
MNRGALSSNPSPYQKASFESTVQFLTSAAIFGETDFLKTPSASIVMGKVAKTGTGSFELRQPLNLTKPVH